ncbi:RNA-directed DNA polymerase, eukaryota, reverse transcriptase zinc-binding domain protein [Tanacetum coccineum]
MILPGFFLAGDFNVTLKLNEHSAGGSSIFNDMQDLIDCVNDVEIEDICSSRMFYTWIKSPKKVSSSVMKRFDRIMINEGFMSKFGEAYGLFLPFVTSDHSEAVLTIPESIPKKFKAFRFANYIVDKPEFSSTVKKGWELEINGCNMFKVTKLKEDLKHAQIQMEKNPHDPELKKKEAECLENYIEASRRHGNRVTCICNKEDTKFERDMVAEQFVTHFHNFLGTVDNVTPIVDANDLFKNELNDNEATNMIRDVTNAKIKNIVFDIDDAKCHTPQRRKREA